MAQQKYLCIQRSQTAPSGKREAPSPAQMEQMYAQFTAWRETFRDNIVDLGGQLKAGGKLVTFQGEVDGPSVEMKELIGGYMIVTADSLEQAAEIARQCPGVVRPGSSVEVREISAP